MERHWLKLVSKGASKVITCVRRLDPRVVHLRDPRRFPSQLTSAMLLGGALAIGAVSFAATNRGSKEAVIPGPPDPPQERPKRQIITKTDLVLPEIKQKKENKKLSTQKHPRFYEPIYVFTDEPVERVSAYPLANPPGVVVDLVGVPEPDGKATQFVGEDDRIRAVRRRTTTHGLRYVIGLTTSVRRINVIHEGQVVMVFPVL
ncbi:MAG: hypothetical protein GY847_04275 [Proteobacteria bacterium]|nr:hypothetical protein [Pseudomonadota bacterium]